MPHEKASEMEYEMTLVGVRQTAAGGSCEFGPGLIRFPALCRFGLMALVLSATTLVPCLAWAQCPGNALWAAPSAAACADPAALARPVSAPTQDTGFHPNGGSWSYLTQGSTVLALDNRDGSLQWQKDWPGEMINVPMPVPSQNGGVDVYLTTRTGRVLRLNGLTGAPIWCRDLRRPVCSTDEIAAPPTIQLRAYADTAFQTAYQDDLIYIVTHYQCGSVDDNAITALGSSNGQPLWSIQGNPTRAVGPSMAGCSIDYGRNLLLCGIDDPDRRNYYLANAASVPTLYAIDVLGKNVRWSAPAGPVTHVPMNRDSQIYVGTADGFIRSFAIDKGILNWQTQTNTPGIAGFWVEFRGEHAGAIMVRDVGGALSRWDDTGTAADFNWRQNNPSFTSGPIVSATDGKVYAGATDGTVVQLDINHGTVEASATVQPDGPGDQRVYEPTLDVAVGTTAINRLTVASGRSVRRFCVPWPADFHGDMDRDGVRDAVDNCPLDPNLAQSDGDLDGVGNACDSCPGASDRNDADLDGLADACDPEPAIPNGRSCRDANGCNGHESCQAGICTSALSLTCDDADGCTHDLCTDPEGIGRCQNVTLISCGGAQFCSDSIVCGSTDIDGDGLNDTWENQGFIDVDCNGQYDQQVDTPLPNADVNKPNIYVAYDFMYRSTGNPHSHEPGATVLQMLEEAFAAQNVIITFHRLGDGTDEDPDGPAGPLSGDHSVISPQPPNDFPSEACVGPNAHSLYSLKAAHFPSSLEPAYHYAMFAHHVLCPDPAHCATCQYPYHEANRSGYAELPGNDLTVALGFLVDHGLAITDHMVAGTFMHELGHNFGLRHGGGDDIRDKPNYLSVMNYNHQFGIGYTTDPGLPALGTRSVPPPMEYRLDYSGHTLGTLYEGVGPWGNCTPGPSGGLDETKGITGHPLGADSVDVATYIQWLDTGSGLQPSQTFIPTNGSPVDWNGRPPTAQETSVCGDINGDGRHGILYGFDDWRRSSPFPGATRVGLRLDFECNSGNWATGIGTHQQSAFVAEPTWQEFMDQGFLYRFKHVSIDIRPGCSTNTIDRNIPSLVPVAVLGSPQFGVTEIDDSSLNFAGAPARQLAFEDVDGDGWLDLVAQFDTADLRQLDGDATSASLTGRLFSSQRFGGTDFVTLGPTSALNVHIIGDAAGYSATIFNTHDGSFASFSLDDCIADVTDPCGNTVPFYVTKIVRITSDEIDSGNHGKSWYVSSDMQIDSSSLFRVRQARNDSGDGRVYTVEFYVKDLAGNYAEASCQIQVKGGANAPAALDSGSIASVSNND